MLLLRKPSPATIRDFLAKQARLNLTYAAVGATNAVPPAGYVVNHTRIKLGQGEGVFWAGKAALERWEQFRLGWLEASPQETPIRHYRCRSSYGSFSTGNRSHKPVVKAATTTPNPTPKKAYCQ